MDDEGLEAPAPVVPGTGAGNRAIGWVAVAIGLAAIVGAIVLGLPGLPDRPPESGAAPSTSAPPSDSGAEPPSEEPSSSGRAAPSVTPAPTDEPAPPTTELAWTTTGSYPIAAGLSMVDAVIRFDERYIALGVEYEQPLPNLGPTPPHRARVWTSDDGRTWEPVTLGPGFETVRLGTPVLRPDGALLSFGARSVIEDAGMFDAEPAAWTTTDGVTWTEIDPPLEGMASSIEQGAMGMLTVVRPSPSSDVHELWLSGDGVTWERTHSLEADYLDVGAGDEGFAAVGWIGQDDGRPISIASADGRRWIEGSPPAFSPYLEVASFAGDWVVVDDPGGTAPTWFSANGLDWAAHGEVPLRTIPLTDVECREYRAQLTSAGPWLVTSTELTYPCSEGGFTVHGTQYLSVDGAAWTALPLAEGTAGENRSGARVNDALAIGAGLILVGEENGAATFWFGETP